MKNKLPKTLQQTVAELCDGDRNLPSRESVTIQTLEKMLTTENESKINNPADILSMSKEDLVKAYDLTCHMADEYDAQKKAIKDVLADKISGDGEVIGDFTVTKAKRINYSIAIDKARELGAVKDAIDTAILKKLLVRGVDIPHTTTEYLLIKEIIRKK